jgi:hypothetical protein
MLDAGCPHLVTSWFYSTLPPAKCWNDSLNRSWLLPSTYFSVYNSQIICSERPVNYVVDKASLSSSRISREGNGVVCYCCYFVMLKGLQVMCTLLGVRSNLFLTVTSVSWRTARDSVFTVVGFTTMHPTGELSVIHRTLRLSRIGQMNKIWTLVWLGALWNRHLNVTAAGTERARPGQRQCHENYVRWANTRCDPDRYTCCNITTPSQGGGDVSSPGQKLAHIRS